MIRSRVIAVGFWLVGLAALAAPGWAVEPDERLKDPVLEQRARDLSQDIRCVVCQNQSIDDSNAELARDLRVIVRERLVAGDSDQQVLDYLVERYGDFVLLRPPVNANTYLLWGGPVVVLAVGLFAVLVFLRAQVGRRRREAEAPVPLSAEEQARLKRLLDDGDGTG